MKHLKTPGIKTRRGIMKLTSAKRLGRFIKKWRKLNNQKQQDLSDVTGISPVQISKIENGNKKIDFNGLLKLTEFYNLELILRKKID